MSNPSRRLEFTGNWFIDAGVLGFVNLMEEVYGEVWKEEWRKKNAKESEWKFDFLEYLEEKIRENEKLVYYGYFPFGYLLYHAKIRFIFDDINKLKNEIFGNKKGILNKRREEEQKLESIESKSKELKESSRKFKELEKKREKILRNIKRFEEELKNKNEEIENLRNKIKFEKDKLYELFFGDNGTREEDKIKKFFSDFKLKTPAIGRNFALFNSGLTKDSLGSLQYIRYLVELDGAIRSNNQEKYNKIFKEFTKFVKSKIKKRKDEGLTYEIIPDSTINPFLYSDKQFSNIGYTFLPSVKQIIQQLKPPIPLYIGLLSFEQAFLPISEKNIMFYTNNLKVCYSVNKRLKIKLEKAREKNRGNIFYLTWSSVLDELIERKSEFLLENMYIVELNIEKNKLSSIEYIGIPKLQASVLLDDRIRNAINNNLQVRGKNFRGNKNVWLLEEFIKGKPLYPLALQHIKLRLTGDTSYINYSAILYSLLIDASILEFREKEGKNKKTLFSTEFFENSYSEITKKVKEEFPSIFYYTINETKRLIPDENRKRIAYLLLGSLYGGDKARFLNILLKSLNNSKEIINQGFLEKIFEKIINNDKSWHMYALCLTAGVAYKNEQK